MLALFFDGCYSLKLRLRIKSQFELMEIEHLSIFSCAVIRRKNDIIEITQVIRKKDNPPKKVQLKRRYDE